MILTSIIIFICGCGVYINPHYPSELFLVNITPSTNSISYSFPDVPQDEDIKNKGITIGNTGIFFRQYKDMMDIYMHTKFQNIVADSDDNSYRIEHRFLTLKFIPEEKISFDRRIPAQFRQRSSITIYKGVDVFNQKEFDVSMINTENCFKLTMIQIDKYFQSLGL
jgi:hypothetical protein